ncbi:hypothetical protein GGR57DRAFT_118114 [Xylariaceae sp. FL1272]|nr:hypothetical protein GGR57DRAFT_118114 [Xylariaceae sp. FL1272]
MATPWIDVHGHFHLPMSEAQVQQAWKYGNAHGFVLQEPFRWSVSSTLDYMDRAGIAFQFLSNIPKTLDALRASNDYGASVVTQHPDRFGLLAAVPTDSAANALLEIERAVDVLNADGFAVTCCYNDVYLSDPKLNRVWEKLNSLEATVSVHPNAYAPPVLGMPVALVEVAFETCRTVVSMLYSGHFAKYPEIRFIIAHCGGALSVLRSRLELLGAESWVPNPLGLTSSDIREQLGCLYVDTAATCPSGLDSALGMMPASHVVYGADCGVPCSTERTMEANRQEILRYKGLDESQIAAIGYNVLAIFPKTVARLKQRRVPWLLSDPAP